tara:strand:- start:702 stop:1352 length:651 start_codon:yes stop_codon:yes gene_type:complete
MTDPVNLCTREGTLDLLFRKGELSVSNLASSIGVSVQLMRRHLRSLQRDDLVESISISYGCGNRSANIWHLISQGNNSFNSDKGSENYALELLNSLENPLSSKYFHQILTNQTLIKPNFYRKKIGSGEITNTLKKIFAIRTKELDKTDFYPCKNNLLSWYLKAFHCSIRVIVDYFPVICDQESKLIKYIFLYCQFQRVQWKIEMGKACGFKLTLNL